MCSRHIRIDFARTPARPRFGFALVTTTPTRLTRIRRRGDCVYQLQTQRLHRIDDRRAAAHAAISGSRRSSVDGGNQGGGGLRRTGPPGPLAARNLWVTPALRLAPRVHHGYLLEAEPRLDPRSVTAGAYGPHRTVLCGHCPSVLPTKDERGGPRSAGPGAITGHPNVSDATPGTGGGDWPGRGIEHGSRTKSRRVPAGVVGGGGTAAKQKRPASSTTPRLVWGGPPPTALSRRSAIRTRSAPCRLYALPPAAREIAAMVEMFWCVRGRRPSRMSTRVRNVDPVHAEHGRHHSGNLRGGLPLAAMRDDRRAGRVSSPVMTSSTPRSLVSARVRTQSADSTRAREPKVPGRRARAWRRIISATTPLPDRVQRIRDHRVGTRHVEAAIVLAADDTITGGVKDLALTAAIPIPRRGWPPRPAGSDRARPYPPW